MTLPQEVSLKDRCRREVEELHQFFKDWLSGSLPETEEAFKRVERALTPDFQLIHPSGRRQRREEILSGLRRAHGSQPSLTIEIREATLLQHGKETAIATYEEWQGSNDRTDGRISTVAFRLNPSRSNPEAPKDLIWQHVHETWLQQPESP
jgi:hypothetical protein